MGFYLRKSISAGPFRFNLSGSGVGLSVGVKGFRVGTGPRGNYVHMGRGGLYYRSSLGGPIRSARPPRPVYPTTPVSLSPGTIVETGNVLDMKPSNGSQIVEQINEKLALFPLRPWPLIAGIGLALYAFSQPNGRPFGSAITLIAVLLTAFLIYYDRQRKTVVIMYDLDDTILHPFQRVTEEFDKLAEVARIWNVDSAERTTDWKRNAGAGQLLTRKPAYLSDKLPGVIKTNLSIPAIARRCALL